MRLAISGQPIFLKQNDMKISFCFKNIEKCIAFENYACYNEVNKKRSK